MPSSGLASLDAATASVAAAASGRVWFSWSYVIDHRHLLTSAATEHMLLTGVAVAIGLAIALPLALLARRLPWTRTPILGLTGALYTIPSLALFAALLPVTGLTRRTVEIGLVGYTLLILVRNILTGLTGVPEEVREAARGMGFGAVRLLIKVELPLALPAIVAGVRIATVSTIGLVTIGALVGYGGLGNLILTGFNNNFYRPEITAAVLGCVLLAVAADVLLLGVQKLLTPWRRR